jgi:peptidoglycan/LPS O-acetylase OafA/YrhL
VDGLIDFAIPTELSGPIQNDGYLLAYGKLRFIVSHVVLFFGAISYSLFLLHRHFGFVVIHASIDRGINTVASISIAVAAQPSPF